ncbi:MAG: hypothetical protein J0L64_27805 [Acidobacteria bacterium]|nr:hypothetical protein [Acidobacteriota bacterium]
MLAVVGVTVLGWMGSGWVSAHRQHYRRTGEFAPLTLSVELWAREGSIGIPGISRMYEAGVTNFGILPRRVLRCRYVDDTANAGQMVLYRVERKAASAKVPWETVVDLKDACRPYPTAFGSTELVTTWLWPGEQLSTGEEATAARGPFRKGDRFRFVLYMEPPSQGSHTIATREEVIDEVVEDSEGAYRVRH